MSWWTRAPTVAGMGLYTPAGKDLSAAVWATLDAAGIKGLDVAEAAQWPDTFDGGFRLSGQGDKVEVFYSVDAEYARAHPDAQHDRIAAVMLSAIADVLLAAIADIAKARGIAKIAADAGLGRESLYKTLAPGSKPRMDTVFKLLRALGVKLNAVPEGVAAA